MYPNTSKNLSQDAFQAKELSRLLTAAVINPEFRTLLLTNPPVALSNGYNGEKFNFGPTAQTLIFSIHANSIEEFASSLVVNRNNVSGTTAKKPVEESPLYLQPIYESNGIFR